MHAAPHYDFAHATAALIAIAALLSGLELLAVKQLHEQVRVYAVLSAFAAGYTLLVGVDRVDAALIVLAAWTAVIKVIVIPVAIDRAMLALTAGLAALAFVRAIGMTFLGMPRDRSIRPQAESRSARVGMGLLAVASLAIGVAAPWVVDVLERGMLPVGVAPRSVTSAS